MNRAKYMDCTKNEIVIVFNGLGCTCTETLHLIQIERRLFIFALKSGGALFSFASLGAIFRCLYRWMCVGWHGRECVASDEDIYQIEVRCIAKVEHFCEMQYVL